MKELKSLDKNNSQINKTKDTKDIDDNLYSITCPMCHSELCDTEPSITLFTNPQKKSVHCNVCGFIGYRNIKIT